MPRKKCSIWFGSASGWSGWINPGARDAFEHHAGTRSVRQTHGLERQVVLSCQGQHCTAIWAKHCVEKSARNIARMVWATQRKAAVGFVAKIG